MGRLRGLGVSAAAVAVLFLAAPAFAGAEDLHAYAGGAATAPTECPEVATPSEGCDLTDALSLAAAGDTVILETSGSDAHYLGNWSVETEGTSEAEPLTIEGDPGLSDQPVLDGNHGSASSCETSACNGTILSIDTAAHVNVAGLTFENASNTSAAENESSGGAIDNSAGGTLSVSNSTFAHNSATSGAGFQGAGGAISNADGVASTLSVSNSTFVENSSWNGGAIGNSNRAVAAGAVSVVNSTFVNNHANGGIGGAINSSGTGSTLTVVSSSFRGNTGSSGAPAIGNSLFGTGGTATVAANLFADGCDQGTGTWIDVGYNATVNASCLNGGPGNASPSAAVADDLDSLQDNGGPTETLALMPGNPAIGLIPNPTVVTIDSASVDLCPTTDQRGVSNRSGAACHAGAAQLVGQPVEFTSSPPSPAITGGDYEPTATGDGESGFPLTMTIDPSSTPGACSISGGPGNYVVSFDGVGRCTINAQQTGDANYQPGSAQQTVRVLFGPGVDLYAYADGGAIDPSECQPTTTVSEQCTLAAALELAGPGNTILLGTAGSDNHYVGNWSVNTPGTDAANPLTIEFAPGLSDRPVLDGNEGEAAGCETAACDETILAMKQPGHLDVSGVAFEHANDTDGFGGALENEVGTMTVTGASFADNNAGTYGGAIYNHGGGTLTVVDSTFSGNTSNWGGAIYSEEAVLKVSSSTFAGNVAQSEGGAIYGWREGTIEISSSTFGGNTAELNGGAIYIEGEEGTLNLSSSTFADNAAGELGDAVANTVYGGPEGTVNAAGNLFAEGCAKGDGTWNDLGYNAGVDGTCQNGGEGNATDPAATELGALQDNGGPTETFLPLPGNPAVDSIPNGTEVTLDGSPLTLCPRTDQRGRASVASLACAAGAVQIGTPGPPTSPSATPGHGEATLSWVAAADDGGSPLTGYEVSCDPSGSASVGPGATEATLTGLTNGTEYECEVTATNAYGASPPAEVSVTPTAPPPTVTNVDPTAGPTAGSTVVTITGTEFNGATAVKFGTTDATTFSIESATEIKATAPSGSPGLVDVSVTTPGGTSANTAADDYTYVAAPIVTAISPDRGPTPGGTVVTITGTNLSGVDSVMFGATSATSVIEESATQIKATSPAGTGTVDVTATTAGGTSANTAADDYTYVAAPTVTALSPDLGPTAGGTVVTITGTEFNGATAVKFGTTDATTFSIESATEIKATAPSGSPGLVDVSVTTPGGTSANTAADDYTYVAAPTVTALSPDRGPTAGGTVVTITGTNLSGVDSVRFGATSATSVVEESATQIKATSPAGAGTVDVTATTAGGTSASTAADDYTYEVPTRQLTVQKSGSGRGTVAGSPAGIDCGPTCSASFTEGTVVTLTATASPGSIFTGWSGDCSGTDTCVISLDSAKSVTANFDAEAPSTSPTPQAPTSPAPPDTTFAAKARIKVKKGRARFWFAASGEYHAYQCALLRKGKKRKHGAATPPKGRGNGANRKRSKFRPCRSPRTYKHLKPGRYVFAVRAVGPGGVDKTPVKRKFRIHRR